MLSAEEQLHTIASGAAQIVPESALVEKLKRGKPLNIKLGVDPTAPDIHLGHAVPLRKLRQFQDLGHGVTLIIGDGTALIGDPSGRNSTRPQLTSEQIKANAQTYVDQAFKILDPEKTTLRYNSEWLLSLNMEGLLKLASNFTVARILERDDFHNRYTSNQSISRPRAHGEDGHGAAGVPHAAAARGHRRRAEDVQELRQLHRPHRRAGRHVR